MAKKKQALEAIEVAVRRAREQGIEICRRPMFDWSGERPNKALPRACCALGAVLLSMGYGKSVLRYNGLEYVYGAGKERPKGWLGEVCEHLGVTGFWLRCFGLGWENIQVYNPEVNDKGIVTGWKEDEVSKAAKKMAKRLAKW